MSVPVDPRVEASDTATDVSDVSPSLTTPSTVQRFSERPLPRREWFISDADLLAMGIQPPIHLPPRPTLTYVVQRQQWVKIGKTAVSIEARLYALRLRKPGVRCPADMDLAAPLELRHTITGDVEDELHARFAEYRVAGEWFIAGPVLAGLGVPA